MIAALGLAALVTGQAGTTLPPAMIPPPIIVPAPAPPPAIRALTLGPPVIIPLHVRVMGGNAILLDDNFRVTRGSGASFSQSRSEAPASYCTDHFFGITQRQSVNVALYPRDEIQGKTQVSVSVSWQRPSDLPQCGADGSRSVSLSEVVTLSPGQTVTIRGDGGLLVTLGRR